MERNIRRKSRLAYGFIFPIFLFADYLQYKFGHHSLNPVSSKVSTQIRGSSKISKVRRYLSGCVGRFESWRKFPGLFFFFSYFFHIVWSLGHNNFGQLYIKHVGVRCLLLFYFHTLFSVTTFLWRRR
ncbi:hypothetical protein BDD12DRAFT_42903 [Trichophaea hybrida]|nr:hypothetical protein BDD12DRAFT_42903 [Trichophaea hybrida]